MKILFLAGHMSTGGMPQVVLKRVELLKDIHDVYVIEYKQLAWKYVVQRDKLIELLGDHFITLGRHETEELRDHFSEYIEKISPDVIHMEEIPEMFMRQEHAEWLYRPDRPYKIIECTHTSTFNVDDKKFFPDKFMFVSQHSMKQYSKFNIPSTLAEYPITSPEINKSQSIDKLEFDPEYLHILNVGLFNEFKNQGYVFEIAKKMIDYKVNFHFIGNQATNFKDYWEPLLTDKPENCFVWGERSDVDIFYQASDMLIHPSTLELNPLAVREALSYNIPVFLKKLDTYGDSYDSIVTYLTGDIDTDVKTIIDKFSFRLKGKNENDDSDKFKDLMYSEYDSILPEKYNYNISFVDGAKFEVTANKRINFDVEFIDKQNPINNYKTTLETVDSSVVLHAKTNIVYYREWQVNVMRGGNLIESHDFNLKGKRVFVQLDSKSIGDTLAWFPYVEEFRKIHDCEMYCSTFWNKWFIKKYPNINFVEPDDNLTGIYARYIIGWFQPWSKVKNPNDYKRIPLQKTASDILGLPYNEIIPKVNAPIGTRPIKEKYVCIAQFSTANAKHWHYPYKDSNIGWQILVDWLNVQGYKVVAISKQATKLKNIINRTGNFPIEHRINELSHCEFFIGIGSGLSWLAWALGKKVLMISGFSDPICEFKTGNINVHNFNVCNGCFNSHEFDRGTWDWCPEYRDTERHFECTKNISPNMVVEQIIKGSLVAEPIISFDFDKYTKDDVSITPELFNITYEIEKNKITFNYSGEDRSPELHVQIKDGNNPYKIYQCLTDVTFAKEYSIWTSPGDVLHALTDKIIITFLKFNKILDIELKIK